MTAIARMNAIERAARLLVTAIDVGMIQGLILSDLQVAEDARTALAEIDEAETRRQRMYA